METTILKAETIEELDLLLHDHTKPHNTYTVSVISIGGISCINGKFLLPIVTEKKHIHGSIQPNK